MRIVVGERRTLPVNISDAKLAGSGLDIILPYFLRRGSGHDI